MADWIEHTELIAYGVLNLHPDAFAAMQPQEIMKMVDGYKDRLRREDERQAYFTAWQMNTMLKKPVSAQELLEPIYPDEIKKQRAARREDDERALRAEFGQ